MIITMMIIGETGARCNNFAFELHNFLRKENKPKQNITFGSPFSNLKNWQKRTLIPFHG